MDKTINYLQGRIDQLQGYHNHKEIMSNAGFVVQLTLFSTIIIDRVWPPEWVNSITIYGSISIFIVYTFFWFVTHIYIAWQLQNKIVSSLYINAYINVLKQYIYNEESLNECVPDLSITLKEERSLIGVLIRLILPRRKVSINYDLCDTGYPDYIIYYLQKSFNAGTSSQFHEKLLIYASLIMWVLASIRILC